MGNGSGVARAAALSPGGGAGGAARAAGGSGARGFVCGAELQAAASTAGTNSRFMVSPRNAGGGTISSGRRGLSSVLFSAEIARAKARGLQEPSDRVLFLRRERVHLLPADVPDHE